MGARGLCCLLLQVVSSVVSGQDPGLSLCSEQGRCYSLHSAVRGYREAEAACGPRGRLTSMKDEEEGGHIVRLLEEGAPPGLDRAWIGLSKPAAQCVVGDKVLRGFQWAPGEEGSELELWATSYPQLTCTSAKCVALQRSEGPAAWHWKEYACSKRYPYLCRQDHPGACSSLDLYHGKLVYQQPFLVSRSPVFSPVGTEATATCYSGERNETVTCQQQAGGPRWVSARGLHPICPCPTGSEPIGTGPCVDIDECQGMPCGERACRNTLGGFICLQEAPMTTTGGISPSEDTPSVPGTRLAPQAQDEEMMPSQHDETTTWRPSAGAEPGPTGHDHLPTPRTGPSVDGGLVPTLGASEASSFPYVLVPAVLAAVTLGILTLFVVAIFKMCFRRRGREGKASETVPAAEGTDPEAQNMPSVDRPEENGL